MDSLTVCAACCVRLGIMFRLLRHAKQDRQCTHNVTLRLVDGTIICRVRALKTTARARVSARGHWPVLARVVW